MDLSLLEKITMDGNYLEKNLFYLSVSSAIIGSFLLTTYYHVLKPFKQYIANVRRNDVERIRELCGRVQDSLLQKIYPNLNVINEQPYINGEPLDENNLDKII